MIFITGFYLYISLKGEKITLKLRFRVLKDEYQRILMSNNLSILLSIHREVTLSIIYYFPLFIDESVKLHMLTVHQENVSLYRVGATCPWHRWQHDSCTCYLLGSVLHLLHHIPLLRQYSIRPMNLRVQDTVKYVISGCMHMFYIFSTETKMMLLIIKE